MPLLSGCHLWLIAFDQKPSIHPCFDEQDLQAAKLSSEDRERFNRYRPLEKKRQFLNSRLAVRLVLERQFGQAATDLTLRSSPSGQPKIFDASDREFCSVSLSHSRSLVAIVISMNSGSVGVDIEVHQPLDSRKFQHVATTDEELSWIESQGEKNNEAFLAIWTIKEAVWKAQASSEIAVSDICIDCSGKDLSPRFARGGFESNRWRIQPFSSDSEAFLPDRMLVTGLPSVEFRFTGCVCECIESESKQ
jgi:phosphopantetheinyl transferase